MVAIPGRLTHQGDFKKLKELCEILPKSKIFKSVCPWPRWVQLMKKREVKNLFGLTLSGKIRKKPLQVNILSWIPYRNGILLLQWGSFNTSLLCSLKLGLCGIEISNLPPLNFYFRKNIFRGHFRLKFMEKYEYKMQIRLELLPEVNLSSCRGLMISTR